METGTLKNKCSKYLDILCNQITGRCVGSEGNMQATIFLGKEFSIAVSSKLFIDNIAEQDITHTPKDNPGIVDCGRLEEIAEALDWMIRKL